jgi:NADH-quinone oxidoreductase subunit L
MIAALGLGPPGHTAAFFHLFTHAFFKALLFLAAGSIIHAVHSNNMSDMGGLRKFMPVTFWTLLIGAVALAGIPPLAGFWSKDEIIAEAFREEQYGVWVISILAAVLTAFYMARAVSLTFFGTYRGHGHPHESPRIMTAPLVILAALAAVAGFFGAPFVDGGFRELVHFGEEAHIAGFDFALAGLSVLLALAGIAVGVVLYRRFREPDPLRRLGPFYTLLDRRYYLDDIYIKGVVRPIQYPIARAVVWIDTHVLDGIVNGVGKLTRLFGRGTDVVDRRVVDGAVNRVAIGTGWTGGLLRYIQSGNVQRYAVFLFAGVAILAVIFTRI